MIEQHCAYENCTEELANARQGVFCLGHDVLYDDLCRIRGCNNTKVENTQTCNLHHDHWYRHVVWFGHQTLLGIHRVVRRTEQETQPWLPQPAQVTQPHDNLVETAPTQRDNYFTAPRFYCVETICAPCGVVEAWAKFARAESPTNILAFLDSVYPEEHMRPDYVCIDKACAVLRTSISNGSWLSWRQTTQFIVDAYHYINHRTTDYLCCKWCNPAPLNGSAPNLVTVAYDAKGQPHCKRAFNTQV